FFPSYGKGRKTKKDTEDISLAWLCDCGIYAFLPAHLWCRIPSRQLPHPLRSQIRIFLFVVGFCLLHSSHCYFSFCFICKKIRHIGTARFIYFPGFFFLLPRNPNLGLVLFCCRCKCLCSVYGIQIREGSRSLI